MSDALFKVEKGLQLSVFVDDKPGALAAVTDLLSRHGINILALSLAEGLGHGYVRMVVDRHPEACRVLKEANELILEREVLLLDLANRPGSLAGVTQALAEAKINLEYAYCAASSEVDRGLVVVRAVEPERAAKVLSAGAVRPA